MSWIKIATISSLLVAVSVILSSEDAGQNAPPKDKNGAPTAVTSNPPAASSAVDDDYVIGPDDVLLINVWKEQDLSRPVPVRPDGKITLPLVGDVVASGLTPKQLQANIEQDLGKYISKPAVTVIVQEVKSHRFNVVGQVQKPGSYLLANRTTVLDGLALAGGFREWAKVKSIYVLRTEANGTQTRLPFNYKKVLKGEANGQNVQLKTGDTIVVP
jgi:polysaccharide export outer membrane protein